MLVGCGQQRHLISSNEGIADCSDAEVYKTLYINKIDAKVSLNDDSYDAKLVLYYVPDSIIFLSASNAGFEIVRIGVFQDSTVLINRIDKMVFILKNDSMGNPPPVNFNDLEFLLDKNIRCRKKEGAVRKDDLLVYDFSVQDIAKYARVNRVNQDLHNFEFFQKKTGEYLVGEFAADGEIVLYSNFIVDNITIKARGGNLTLNKILEIDLKVNKAKYDFILL